MAEYKLTEADCKLITEDLLEECWHEPKIKKHSEKRVCKNCSGQLRNICISAKIDRRTFLTPDDMYAVRKALRDKGLWDDFYFYVIKNWQIVEGPERLPMYDAKFIAFVNSDIERFHCLVARFLKERVKK
jgi:hypothetical protein